jgi:hypothetical protein
MYSKIYPVTKVYCVFESEASQRECLEKLTLGLVPSLLDVPVIPKELRFRGKNALLVREASEPNDIIWENLGKCSPSQRVFQRLSSLTYLGFISFGFACLVSIVIDRLQVLILPLT